MRLILTTILALLTSPSLAVEYTSIGAVNNYIIATTNTWSAQQSYSNQIAISSAISSSLGGVNAMTFSGSATTAQGALTVNGALSAAGSGTGITISNNAIIQGSATVNGNFGVLGAVNQPLTVTSSASFTNASFSIGGSTIVVAVGTVTIAGATSINGALTATAANSLVSSATYSTNIMGGANGVLPYQSAANTTSLLGAGSANQFLRSAGAAAPTWASFSYSSAATQATNGTNTSFSGCVTSTITVTFAYSFPVLVALNASGNNSTGVTYTIGNILEDGVIVGNNVQGCYFDNISAGNNVGWNCAVYLPARSGTHSYCVGFFTGAGADAWNSNAGQLTVLSPP